MCVECVVIGGNIPVMAERPIFEVQCALVGPGPAGLKGILPDFGLATDNSPHALLHTPYELVEGDHEIARLGYELESGSQVWMDRLNEEDALWVIVADVVQYRLGNVDLMRLSLRFDGLRLGVMDLIPDELVSVFLDVVGMT